MNIAIPYDSLHAKSKKSEGLENYFEKHCKYVTSQATRQAVDLLTSLMQLNTNERLKEQALLRQAMTQAEEAKKNELKVARLQELRAAIRDSLQKANELTDGNANGDKSVLTNTDIADLEASLELSPKQMNSKASRFKHSEKLQFTKENEESVSVVTSTTEEVSRNNFTNFTN